MGSVVNRNLPSSEIYGAAKTSMVQPSRFFAIKAWGDTINMLRYLYIMKERWSCKIILNCYAYFEQFKRLIEEVDYIDEFVRFHKQCDYHTNIFSLPAILYKVDLPVYYPAHFSLIMEKVVPPQPKLIAHSTFSTCRDVIERVFEKTSNWSGVEI
jgi:hypothetical protein